MTLHGKRVRHLTSLAPLFTTRVANFFSKIQAAFFKKSTPSGAIGDDRFISVKKVVNVWRKASGLVHLGLLGFCRIHLEAFWHIFRLLMTRPVSYGIILKSLLDQKIKFLKTKRDNLNSYQNNKKWKRTHFVTIWVGDCVQTKLRAEKILLVAKATHSHRRNTQNCSECIWGWQLIEANNPDFNFSIQLQ